jgi:hypothetical protein
MSNVIKRGYLTLLDTHACTHLRTREWLGDKQAKNFAFSNLAFGFASGGKQTD